MDCTAPSVVTDQHTRFALALLGAVPASAGGNVVISPWSVSSALAMLVPGCDQQAWEEIVRALAGFAPEVPASAVEGTADGAAGDDTLLTRLAADALAIAGEQALLSDDSVVTIANTLWVDDDRTPVASFTGALERWPGAALRFAPMSRDPDGARRTVNAEVAESTRHLIEELLPDGSLTPDDRAIIVNALYLYAAWVLPFPESLTEDRPFHAPGGTRDVATMHATEELPYACDGWEYVSLPLDLGFAAEVLLPPADGDREGDGAALPGAEVIAALREQARDHRVDLHLPRLRIEQSSVLGQPLAALGVRRIFEPGSVALHSVVVEEPLYVHEGYHAAVLRVDEAGLEGAAATALVARAVAFRTLRSVEVRVDRPFLLLVTHRHTGAVGFAAQVREPWVT
jgi:serine protease inhibitor